MTDCPHSRRELWRAVIRQALSDAVSTAQDGRADLERHEARKWLTKPSRDFDEVCELAGEEPDRVRAIAVSIIAEAEHGPVNLRQRAIAAKPIEKPKPSKPLLPPLPPTRPTRPMQSRQVRHIAGKPAKMLTHKGVTRSATEWAERVGISRTALFNRFAHGWTLERALTEPISPRARSQRASRKRNREAGR